MNDENENFIVMIAETYLRMTQAEKVNQILDQHFEDVTKNVRAMMIKARCEIIAGNKTKGFEILNNMLHQKSAGEKYISEHFIADVYAELGDKEKAFYWLEQAMNNKAPHCSLFAQKTIYEKWRDEPKYKALLKKANLVQP